MYADDAYWQWYYWDQLCWKLCKSRCVYQSWKTKMKRLHIANIRNICINCVNLNRQIRKDTYAESLDDHLRTLVNEKPIRHFWIMYLVHISRMSKIQWEMHKLYVVALNLFHTVTTYSLITFQGWNWVILTLKKGWGLL